jgi:hypothetical protein
MPKPLAGNTDYNCSVGYTILQSQDLLPPYELDPMYDDPVLRKRIGQVIAKTMEQRFSKR